MLTIILRNFGITLAMTAALLSPSYGQDKADATNQAATRELVGKTFEANDTLEVVEDESDDASQCLQGLLWTPGKFTVTSQPTVGGGKGDVLVRFPSPIDSGDANNDSVSMEWHVARDKTNRPTAAKAVVVVHESGSRMSVGRMFARGLRQRGFHAFLIHLPYYGDRRTGARPEDKVFFTLIRQGIADVRRARDAVRVLPLVDGSHIALQGTSLGGMVSATAASIDNVYDSVFLTLAGGNIFEMLQNGERDAAKVRQRLSRAGLSGERLRDAVYHIEPTRLAHRLSPERTWLYSGTLDTVVPLENAMALAESAKLDTSHHIKVLANHYTGIVYLPVILDHIRDRITGKANPNAQ